MEIERFLMINGGILLLLIIFVFFRNPKLKKVATLNERRGGAAGQATPGLSKAKMEPKKNSQPIPASLDGPQDDARSLNVMFVFNGHAFDAYEVLGLPAGSPKKSAEKAYQQAIVDCDEAEIKFYQMALNSILKS